MSANLDEALRRTTTFWRVSADDRQCLAAVASVHAYDKGERLFAEGEASAQLYIVIDGRVKVFKTTARGTDVILELFGPGDPVGAVAVRVVTSSSDSKPDSTAGLVTPESSLKS